MITRGYFGRWDTSVAVAVFVRAVERLNNIEVWAVRLDKKVSFVERWLI